MTDDELIEMILADPDLFGWIYLRYLELEKEKREP